MPCGTAYPVRPLTPVSQKLAALPTTLSTEGSTMSRLGYLRGTRIPSHGTPARSSWRWGRILAALGAVALLGPLAWHRLALPTTLSGYALSGARGPACQRIVVANDVSGSMTAFADARRNALTQLLAWAPANLRPSDHIGVIDFAGSAEWVRMPASVTDPAQQTPTSPGPLAEGTNLGPVIAAVAALPPSRCETSLWLLSDAQYPDYAPSADQAREELAAADIHRIPLLVPSGDITVDPAWETTYPYSTPITFDGHNPDETALAYGGLLSDLTGQELTPIEK